jgi:hypothetical protein
MLQVEAKAEMDDEQALATMNGLRQLEKRHKVEEKKSPWMGRYIETVRDRAPFRFLDLPAEIRNMVYDLILPSRQVLRLRCFVTPAIARSNRALRHETLPYWFAINTFVAEVKSNFVGISQCASHGSKAEYIGEDDSRFKWLGSLDLNAEVTGLLRTAPPRSIKIKNLDFCMKSASVKQDRSRSQRYAVLSLRHGRSTKVSLHVGNGTSEEYTAHVRHVMEQSRAILESLVSCPDYDGLFMLEIREVAAAFRIRPMLADKPSIEELEATSEVPAPGSVKRNRSRIELDQSRRRTGVELSRAQVKRELRNGVNRGPSSRRFGADDDEFDLSDEDLIFAEDNIQTLESIGNRNSQPRAGGSGLRTSTRQALSRQQPELLQKDEFDLDEEETYFGPSPRS